MRNILRGACAAATIVVVTTLCPLSAAEAATADPAGGATMGWLCRLTRLC